MIRPYDIGRGKKAVLEDRVTARNNPLGSHKRRVACKRVVAAADVLAALRTGGA